MTANAALRTYRSLCVSIHTHVHVQNLEIVFAFYSEFGVTLISFQNLKKNKNSVRKHNIIFSALEIPQQLPACTNTFKYLSVLHTLKSVVFISKSILLGQRFRKCCRLYNVQRANHKLDHHRARINMKSHDNAFNE